MRKIIAVAILIVGLSACGSETHVKDKEMIEDVMQGQAVAWNKGNLEGYMTGYWMSDSLVFSGGKSISRGWQAALDRYKISYPNVEAMGKLEFNEIETQFSSKQSAYTIGEWTLFRTSDTLSGRFTLVWKKVNNSWVIIADHSS
jgi:hypothetical protein